MYKNIRLNQDAKIKNYTVLNFPESKKPNSFCQRYFQQSYSPCCLTIDCNFNEKVLSIMCEVLSPVLEWIET